MAGPRIRTEEARRPGPGPRVERLEGKVLPTSFTMTSPTSRGPLPDGVTEVGGIVLDLVGGNGARVVAQVGAGDLFVGAFDDGSPAEFRGNPGTIGERSGFSPEVVDALGGELAELAVRITLFDGDTGPGDFDDDGRNLLLINGEPVGRFDEVATEQTDESGRRSISTNPGGGFRDEVLDTGFFHLTDRAALARILDSIREAGTASFQLWDETPFDNFFDFTSGLDGGLIDGDRPPEPENRPPTLESLRLDGPALEGTPARFVAAGSDPDPGDVLTYEFDFDGDGRFEVSSPLGEATATFPDDGPAFVSARVLDGRGGEARSSLPVVVGNVSPAVRGPSEQESSEGSETSFSLGSFDDPGLEGEWTVSVDWGDGSPAEAFEVEEAGPLGLRPHRYEQDGTYEVTVRVGDGEGQGEATSRVRVRNEGPRLSGASAPGRVELGGPIDLQAGFSDPGRLDAFRATIDWGDGVISRIDLPPGSTSVSAQHEIGRAGTYAITLTVADDRGSAATVSLPVSVVSPEPPAPPPPPPTSSPGSSADRALAEALLPSGPGSAPRAAGGPIPEVPSTPAPAVGVPVATLQAPQAPHAQSASVSPDLPLVLPLSTAPGGSPTPPPPAPGADDSPVAEAEVEAEAAPMLAAQGGEGPGVADPDAPATVRETGFVSSQAPAPGAEAAGGDGSASPGGDGSGSRGARVMVLIVAMLGLRRRRPLTARRLTGAAIRRGAGR
ncbi:PKD domain-containing protein [Tautonia plasticadhaerens]|uniref:PKD domain protein n=1 Tax=Tautonia plasticadhaerens TaxID=2527974 RepID=A0A518H2P2_9BACT|nr:PKD domain-containing protein [Tautonia plasticadhaerens]QDV35083.1 PKD domain protein [Tautonia plasticadhaerens]